MKILTTDEMRKVDQLSTERYRIPSLTLMENAGASVAHFIAEHWSNFANRRTVVLCGKGNNGGDGFVAARHLHGLGARPEVYLLAKPNELRGDAATNCTRWQNSCAKLHVASDSKQWATAKDVLSGADIIIDALLGTGTRGAVEGLLGEVIQDVNRRRGNVRSAVVAVDIPSGLIADTGEAKGQAINAAYTVTFTAPKIGMISGTASDRLGQLVVRDIGSPSELVDEVGKSNVRWVDQREIKHFAIPRRSDGNKGSYGHALIVAGSVGKSGAAVLSSWAALRVGAGLVTVATPESVLPIVAAHTPEIMTEPLPATDIGTISLRSFEYERFAKILKGKRALGIGPGLTTQDETQQFVRAVIGKREVPIILDADGLNAFAGHAQELRNAKGMIALTPHPGEMARLVGGEIKDLQARRLEVASKAAADWNAFVILKGQQTIVASPNGEAFINSTGNPGMATGGTGDVLTGMLAGLTAQFGISDWLRVLAFGVFLHGLAGDVAYAQTGAAPLMASDLIHAIPRAYQRFYSHA